VPVRRIRCSDGAEVTVATVFDLLMAQYGVSRGLGGDYPKGYDDGDKGDKGDKGEKGDDGGRKGEATKKASKDDDDEPHAKTKHVERTYEGERYRRPRREANDAKAAAKGLNIMLGIGGGLKFGGGGGHRGKY